MEGTKACAKCGKVKPLSQFYRDKKRADGRAKICGACDREKGKQYREANRDKERQRNRNYGQRCSETVKNRVRRWRKNNPGKERAKKRMRDAQKINACPPWARKFAVRKKIQAQYLHAEWLQTVTGLSYHVDHIVPLKSDFVCGLHVPENLTVLEASDNISKNAYWWPGQLPCQTGRGSSHAWWRELKEKEHLCDW